MKRMPRRRQDARCARPVYPLAPTMRAGRRRGRPRPGRWTALCSRNGAKTVASWRCPGVSTSVIGWPPPSARNWTFVVSPPRLRPSAAASASPLCPGRMLVRPDHGPIDAMHPPIQVSGGGGLALDGGDEPVPDAGGRPAPNARVHARPRTGPLGQVPPRRSRCQLPQDAVQYQPVVLARRTRRARRQQRL